MFLQIYKFISWGLKILNHLILIVKKKHNDVCVGCVIALNLKCMNDFNSNIWLMKTTSLCRKKKKISSKDFELFSRSIDFLISLFNHSLFFF
jgi:hypothetical protein